MHLLDFTPGHEALISVYESHGAYALPLGEGRGEGHVLLHPHRARRGHWAPPSGLRSSFVGPVASGRFRMVRQ
jgi:hypothetical protein